MWQARSLLTSQRSRPHTHTRAPGRTQCQRLVRGAEYGADRISRPKVEAVAQQEDGNNLGALNQDDNDDNLEEVARLDFNVACGGGQGGARCETGREWHGPRCIAAMNERR